MVVSHTPNNEADAGKRTDSSIVPVLQTVGVSKRFPGVQALNAISLNLKRGEVLAVMGENGAGKSTLMRILGGVQMPDEGAILVEGRPVRISSVSVAKQLGIASVHQELMLAPNLDIASNIFLGNEKSSTLAKVLDRKRMNSEAEDLLHWVGLNIAPTTLVENLTTAQMQMVEICKALSNHARILILDEPTSSLAAHETETLLAIVRELRKTSVSVLYISHRIGEVLQIADRVMVMRDGSEVGTLNAYEAKPGKIVSMMIGRELKNWFPQRNGSFGETVLSLDSVLVRGSKAPVSFEAKRGEILGFAGLVGSGRTELMEALAGIRPAVSGTITFENRTVVPSNPKIAIENGICLVPEDRKLHGLVLSMSVAENVALPGLPYNSPKGIFKRGWQKQIASEAVEKLQIRPPSISAKVMNLSGGNQQKVVLAKWLALQPKLLILDEPTKGIDVGARAEIYDRIVRLADSGITILLVSSDMEEILGLSDRVVVLRERRIAGILQPPEITKELVGALMTGGESAA